MRARTRRAGGAARPPPRGTPPACRPRPRAARSARARACAPPRPAAPAPRSADVERSRLDQLLACGGQVLPAGLRDRVHVLDTDGPASGEHELRLDGYHVAGLQRIVEP